MHPLASYNHQTSTSLYPMHTFVSYDNLSSSHRCFNLKLSTLVEPSFYTKAITNLNWLKSIDLELNSLISTNTWDLEPLPLTEDSLL